MESQVEYAERAARFIKLLPSGTNVDIELIILKGHLLIEELLTELLIVTLEKSNPLNITIRDNTPFSQKLNLFWALSNSMFHVKIWESVKKLNVIRNSMAHSIEPKGIDKKIQEFCNAALVNTSFSPDDYKGNETQFSIAWLHLLLSENLNKIKNS